MSKKELYAKQIKLVNKDIAELEQLLITAINEVGLEYLDIYSFISKRDALVMKKDKLLYLLALEN